MIDLKQSLGLAAGTATGGSNGATSWLSGSHGSHLPL
jgi:hypothetical protein